MEMAEVTSRQPQDGEVATPMPRFLVIVGDSGDGGAAFRIESPSRGERDRHMAISGLLSRSAGDFPPCLAGHGESMLMVGDE
jgi:hypothetical protein